MQITTLECPSCGAPVSLETKKQTLTCAYCGQKLLVQDHSMQAQQKWLTDVLPQEIWSPFSYTTTLMLAIFLGVFGAHRFYTRHLVSGVIQFLTTGGILVWWLWDVFSILNGSFRDAQGRPLKRPERLNLWMIGGAVYLISLFVFTMLARDGRIALVVAIVPTVALIAWLRRKENA